MWWQEAEEARDNSPQGRACNTREFSLHAISNSSPANLAQSRNVEMEIESSHGAVRSEGLAAEAASAAPWAQKPLSGSEINQKWNARIRASIARLVQIEGGSLDSESYEKLAEGHATRRMDQSFHARVDRLQAATKAAHKQYLGQLFDVQSTSPPKKMRLTVESSSPFSTAKPILLSRPPASPRSRYAALDALAVVASTKTTEKHNGHTNSSGSRSKTNNRGTRQQKLKRGLGTVQTPVQVYDPELTRVVDKFTDKLAQLLDQLQTTLDAATAEPILAAAAAIASEATEMRRCEESVLARMVEIEEHRQQIMQGLLDYAKRKEQRNLDKRNENGTKLSSLTESYGSHFTAAPS